MSNFKRKQRYEYIFCFLFIFCRKHCLTIVRKTFLCFPPFTIELLYNIIKFDQLTNKIQYYENNNIFFFD